MSALLLERVADDLLQLSAETCARNRLEQRMDSAMYSITSAALHGLPSFDEGKRSASNARMELDNLSGCSEVERLPWWTMLNQKLLAHRRRPETTQRPFDEAVPDQFVNVILRHAVHGKNRRQVAQADEKFGADVAHGVLIGYGATPTLYPQFPPQVLRVAPHATIVAPHATETCCQLNVTREASNERG